jgi:hypothetical protein
VVPFISSCCISFYNEPVSELEALLNSAEPAEFVDMVTGATLVDNYGYLSAFLAAAKDALGN